MRMNPLTRRAAFLSVGLILTVTSVRPVAAATCRPYGVGFGANELQPPTPCALELASQARIDWVRLGLYWQDVEPSPGQFDFQADDALIASTRATQLNVLAAIVTRYKSNVHYWEMWNEPDLAEFWNGTTAQYAALLD